MIKDILTADEAATFLALKKGYVYNLTYRKEIPFYKPRGRLYFKRQELEAWILQGRQSNLNHDAAIQQGGYHDSSFHTIRGAS